MKKFTAILLSAVLLFSLAACSSEKEGEEVKTDTDAVLETTEPVTEETTLPVTDPVEDKVFSGVTVTDNKYCKIEVTDIKEDITGNSLTVAVENKTDDMTLTFSTESCSINGVAVDTLYADEVTAGKKASGSITFLDEKLRKNGITKYTDIEITFRVYDSENWIDDDLVSETVNIYPYGEDKAETFVRDPKATDITVFDTDKVSATVIGWGESDFSDYCVELYLENKSADLEYMYSVSATAINGIEVMNLGSFLLPAGKVSFEAIDIVDTQLEQNGITEFTDIFFTLRVYDANDWEADDIAENSVHVYPQGEDKAVPFVRNAKDTDTVIADNEYVTVIATGISENDIFSSYDLCFYFINKTDKEVMFSMDDVSVNGYMADPFFAETLQPGFSKFCSATWYEDDLAEKDIESIETIEFTMTAYFAGDWDAEDIISEKVTYSLTASE